jgi:hypothetical protein
MTVLREIRGASVGNAVFVLMQTQSGSAVPDGTFQMFDFLPRTDVLGYFQTELSKLAGWLILLR